MIRRHRPRRCRTGWIAWSLVCLAPVATALELRPAGPPLASTHASVARQLLEDAAGRLPAAVSNALERPIDVEWRSDLPDGVHGRAERNRMLLDRALLDTLVAQSGRHTDDRSAAPREIPASGSFAQADASPELASAAPAPSDDDPGTRAALAAVLHELAHFYDRTPQGQLSRDPRLLDLAGWQVSPARPGRRGHNAFSDRSPDPYELTSPAEFVAVNFEHFLLDPAYACRRPALHRYFSQRLRVSTPAAECAPAPVFVEPDPDQPPLQRLDATRVYQVDYLLAEGNDRAMSRWGHSMLRLVVCAPGRAPGPDCRLDLQHHRVLSFRAFVDDLQVSSWRGLTGSYPSRLFVLPLEQVVDEYTKVELRGLQSIPLRLQPAEIDTLLERAAKLHWSYDGRYYFVSNNCAVETFKLLHAGIPRLSRLRLASITPRGLLRRLHEAGVADAAVLADRDQAVRLGYRFDSAATHYQAMFDVASRPLALPQRRVAQWLALSPEARQAYFDRADVRTTAALLLLEQAALRRQELLARDELKRKMPGRRPANSPADPAGRPARDLGGQLRAALALDDRLSRPSTLLVGAGYGLPQAREQEQFTRQLTIHVDSRRQQQARARHAARDLLSPARQSALAGTEANVGALGERLRQLSRSPSG